MSTYPDQFGGYREDTIPLSADRFRQIAKRFNMSPELQAFESEEDWTVLFDESLQAAVSAACAAIRKEEEESKREKTEKYAIRIPPEYAGEKPDMGLSEVTLELRQRYSGRSICVTNDNGKYRADLVEKSHVSPRVDRCSRLLSDAEAVWLEKQVKAVIRDPDNSEWQSLPGGDLMKIAIRSNKGRDIVLSGKPVRKYKDLLIRLENLAKYGSL